MIGPLRIGEFEIFWLDGGEFELDGGCMFGVVPRALWQKKFPCTEDGHVRLVNSPILVKTPESLVVIDTGLGNKLTDKQNKIFRVTSPWRADKSLEELGIKREDIDHVILTHCDFDHSGGVVMFDADGEAELTWPGALHHVQRLEWEDVLSPHRRAVSTYWPVNLDLLKGSDRLRLVEGESEPVAGIRLQLTGGHTRGHQVVWLDSAGEGGVHLGDLLPNQAYFHPQWITPYDNFPLDSIARKEELIVRAVDENRWFLSYHDPYLAACRFNLDGEIVDRYGELADL